MLTTLVSRQMVLFVTLVALKFNCLSMRTMNVAFACAMLLVSCLALPGMVDSDSMTLGLLLTVWGLSFMGFEDLR